jgi:aminopeptidase N
VTSLTKDEARARADLLRVQSYDIELDLTGDDRHFGSRTTIRFECREPGAATFVDVAAQELRSATLNGAGLDPAAAQDKRLRLDGLQDENELVVDAVMTYSHDGEGLHRHVDPADDRSYLYAMSFLEAAPRWFACFDQPDLKAPVRFDVRCPDDWTVAGNGPATEVEPGHWQLARCSTTPNAASTNCIGCSRSATRGVSTTRRSCRSSTPARWRTRAA